MTLPSEEPLPGIPKQPSITEGAPQRTSYRSRALGAMVAVLLCAGVIGTAIVRLGPSHRPSQATLVLPPAIASSHERHIDTQALDLISMERGRYKVAHESAIVLGDICQLASSQAQARVLQVRREIEELKASLSTRASEPTDPVPFGAPAALEQTLSRFVEEYEAFGRTRRASWVRLFEMQDELAQLSEGSHRDWASLMQSFQNDLLFRPYRSMTPDVGAFVDEGIRQEFWIAVYRVKYEQEAAESALLRRRMLEIIGRPRPTTVDETRELASGPWQLVQVVSGDTFEIRYGISDKVETVRLLNVEAPADGESGFDLALERLQGLVSEGTVQLEFGAPGVIRRDDRGQLLCFVFVDGVFVNLEMVSLGAARYRDDADGSRYNDIMKNSQPLTP